MTSSLGPPPRRDIQAFEPKYINPKDRLVRVFNNSSDRECLSWNPTRLAPNDKRAGRFDRLTKEDSPFLYAAFAPKEYGAETAIYETLRPYIKWDNRRERRVIRLAELKIRSLQYFSVHDEVALASLVEAEHQGKLNAPEEVTYSADRAMTRRWGHYFQSKLDDGVAGLAYHSTAATRGRGPSVILWEKALQGNRFVDKSPEVRLDTGPGRNLVNVVLSRHSVLVVGRTR